MAKDRVHLMVNYTRWGKSPDPACGLVKNAGSMTTDEEKVTCKRCRKSLDSTEPTYPCKSCGKPRTKAEGGTTFTVCDACWDKPSDQKGDA